MSLASERGREGEEVAAAYLQSLGYRIEGRNVRFGRLEIDIIAYDPAEKMMVFAEVKTRTSHSAAYPIHTAVDARKRKALRKAIAKWVNEKKYEGPGRLDLIGVQHGKIVEHIKDLGSDFF